MTIIRWKLRPDAERYFSRNIENKPESSLPENCGCLPETNIQRHQDHYRIDMAAPGRNKNDFNIKLEENLLTISYQKTEQENSDGNTFKYLRKEFDNNAFTRHFTLPETTDKEKIFAKYENGILSVNIPFDDPEKNRISKKININ
jgi:HSP20 family protein